jgi:hypothetical protein
MLYFIVLLGILERENSAIVLLEMMFLLVAIRFGLSACADLL